MYGWHGLVVRDRHWCSCMATPTTCSSGPDLLLAWQLTTRRSPLIGLGWAIAGVGAMTPRRLLWPTAWRHSYSIGESSVPASLAPIWEARRRWPARSATHTWCSTW